MKKGRHGAATSDRVSVSQRGSASDPGSKPPVTIPKVANGGISPQKHWRHIQSTGLGIKHVVAPELGVRSMAMDPLSEGQWFLHDNCFRLKGKPSHSQYSISRTLFSEGRRERWGEVGRKKMIEREKQTILNRIGNKKKEVITSRY